MTNTCHSLLDGTGAADESPLLVGDVCCREGDALRENCVN
jgi:hypothetical protein